MEVRERDAAAKMQLLTLFLYALSQIFGGTTQMKSMSRKALFGGALFVAGIVSKVDAQWMLSPDHASENYTRVYAFSYAYSAPDWFFHDETNYGSGSTNIAFGSYNDPYIGGYAGASLSNSHLSAFLDTTLGWSGQPQYSYAQVVSQAYITVPGDTSIELSWDLTGYGQGVAHALFDVHDVTANEQLLPYGHQYIGTAGALSIDILEGHLYKLKIKIIGTSPQELWASITKAPIPAPGSLALLGIAALGVRRRRRIGVY